MSGGDGGERPFEDGSSIGGSSEEVLQGVGKKALKLDRVYTAPSPKNTHSIPSGQIFNKDIPVPLSLAADAIEPDEILAKLDLLRTSVQERLQLGDGSSSNIYPSAASIPLKANHSLDSLANSEEDVAPLGKDYTIDTVFYTSSLNCRLGLCRSYALSNCCSISK